VTKVLIIFFRHVGFSAMQGWTLRVTKVPFKSPATLKRAVQRLRRPSHRGYFASYHDVLNAPVQLVLGNTKSVQSCGIQDEVGKRGGKTGRGWRGQLCFPALPSCTPASLRAKHAAQPFHWHRGLSSSGALITPGCSSIDFPQLVHTDIFHSCAGQH
jgi:hypothetical protein